MIQKMRQHTYTKPSTELDSYGQYPQINGGTVLMAISNKNNHPVTSNPLYNEAEYVGVTYNKDICEGCIVDGTLQVLYVIKGRYNQVFMKNGN